MGMTVYDTATSLTGHIADESNSLDWLFEVPNGDAPDTRLFPESAAVLVEGSTTYEWVLDHERARDFNAGKPVFVFTTRSLRRPADMDVRFCSGPVADHLDAIRAAAGEGDIWVVGGGDLAGQFLDAGALDEVAVSIAPVLLTGGAPLLPRRLRSDRLHLRSATAVGQFARLVYDVRNG